MEPLKTSINQAYGNNSSLSASQKNQQKALKLLNKFQKLYPGLTDKIDDLKKDILGNFLELPAELQVMIFQYLDIKDLASAQAVCKVFQAMAANEIKGKVNQKVRENIELTRQAFSKIMEEEVRRKNDTWTVSYSIDFTIFFDSHGSINGLSFCDPLTSKNFELLLDPNTKTFYESPLNFEETDFPHKTIIQLQLTNRSKYYRKSSSSEEVSKESGTYINKLIDDYHTQWRALNYGAYLTASKEVKEFHEIYPFLTPEERDPLNEDLGSPKTRIQHIVKDIGKYPSENLIEKGLEELAVREANDARDKTKKVKS